LPQGAGKKTRGGFYNLASKISSNAASETNGTAISETNGVTNGSAVSEAV
jgi:hypothetical protein